MENTEATKTTKLDSKGARGNHRIEPVEVTGTLYCGTCGRKAYKTRTGWSHNR